MAAEGECKYTDNEVGGEGQGQLPKQNSITGVHIILRYVWRLPVFMWIYKQIELRVTHLFHVEHGRLPYGSIYGKSKYTDNEGAGRGY